MFRELFDYGAAVEGTSGGGPTKLVCDHLDVNTFTIAEVNPDGTVVYDSVSGCYRRIDLKNLDMNGVAIYTSKAANFDPSTSTRLNLGPHTVNIVVNASPIVTFNEKTIPLADRQLEAIRYPHAA